MGQHADQLAAIAAAGAGITNIGRIHDRPRFGDAAAHWTTDIDGITQIRAWEIGVGAEGIQQARASQGHLHRYTPWEIVGYLTLVDADDAPDIADPDAHYHTLLELAIAWSDALEANRSLSGSALDLTDPVQIDDPEPFRLGGAVLCWATRLRFTAYSIIAT